jgi:hypothetical protein
MDSTGLRLQFLCYLRSPYDVSVPVTLSFRISFKTFLFLSE